MNIAVFSLTRDRLYYTQRAFALLREKAGHPFGHYVVDNGSEDGTREWLLSNPHPFAGLHFNTENRGLAISNNQGLNMIAASGVQYDLIARMDNDCECQSDSIVAQMVEVYQAATKPMLLSPRVTGINRQPKRGVVLNIGGHRIGVTNHIGGLFHWLNADLYLSYRYPLDIPKASGDDSALSYWVYQQGYPVGYVEDLVVEHAEGTDNQALRYPEYFERKFREERE